MTILLEDLTVEVISPNGFSMQKNAMLCMPGWPPTNANVTRPFFLVFITAHVGACTPRTSNVHACLVCLSALPEMR